MARSIYAQNLLNLSKLDPANSGEAVRSGLLADAFRQLEAKKQKRTEDESTRRFDLQFGLSEKSLQDQIESRERAFQLNLRNFQQGFFERGAGTPDERTGFLESIGFSTPPTDISVGSFGGGGGVGGGGPGTAGLQELVNLYQTIQPSVQNVGRAGFDPNLAALSGRLASQISGGSTRPKPQRRTFGAKRTSLPNTSSAGSSAFANIQRKPLF